MWLDELVSPFSTCRANATKSCSKIPPLVHGCHCCCSTSDLQQIFEYGWLPILKTLHIDVFMVLTKQIICSPHGRPEQSVPAPGGHKCLCAKVHANCVWHVVLPSRPCETRWCSPGDGLNETHIHNAEVHSKHCAVPMFAFRLARPKAIAIYTRLQQDQQISCKWLAHLKISRLSW